MKKLPMYVLYQDGTFERNLYEGKTIVGIGLYNVASQFGGINESRYCIFDLMNSAPEATSADLLKEEKSVPESIDWNVLNVDAFNTTVQMLCEAGYKAEPLLRECLYKARHIVYRAGRFCAQEALFNLREKKLTQEGVPAIRACSYLY